MPDWNSLPFELRAMILMHITHHDSIARLAAVSEEWRDAVEKKTFRCLKLHPSSLNSLGRLAERQRRHVKHIWLNIELRGYSCRTCRKMESNPRWSTNDKIMTAAIARLFSLSANWRQDGELTLELNAYSPSDSEHWFKNCYFGAPGEDELELVGSDSEATATPIHDPSHGWFHGQMIEAPNDDALRRPFEPATLKFEQELPSVHAVTTFLLRRQCRRQLDPSTLTYIFSKLPQLQEVRYEPWQLSEAVSQPGWDRGYKRMIRKRLPTRVRTVIIYKDFNENYLEIFERSQGLHAYLNPERVRRTTAAVGASLAYKSRQLEHLSVAFLSDAWDFFRACQRHVGWRWDQLRSLTLTSREMYNTSLASLRTNQLLEAAGTAALGMPMLETMTLWNGARGMACAFTWCRRDALISWRGTWDLQLEYTVVDAWKKVAYTYARHGFTVHKELLTQEIRSHGDAIHYLGLHHVVDEVSLRQIRKENNWG